DRHGRALPRFEQVELHHGVGGPRRRRDSLMKMKAGVLTTCGAPRLFARSKPIQVVEVDLDPPGEGEILVKVGGGGLCHSDLSLINGDRPRPVPIVLGHEGSGEIVEVGSGVHDVKKGDHVCFTFNVSCGRCRRCLEGRPWSPLAAAAPSAVGLSGPTSAVPAGAGRIVAVILPADKLGLASQRAATDTVNAKDADHVQQVRDLTHGGVDYACDLTGTIKT